MGRRSTLTLVLTLLFSSAFWLAPIASAQDAPTGASGISVIGYGEATAPAETATLMLAIGEGNYGPPLAPQAGATPGAREREKVAPTVASLVDAGVVEADIEVFVGPALGNAAPYSGAAVAVLRLKLETPTLEKINGLIDAASVGAADENLIVGGVGVSYSVEDCDALDRQAREAAIADARKRAEVQADLLGVTLGEVTGSHDVPPSAPTTLGLYGPPLAIDGCSEPSLSGNTLGSIYSWSFDPTAESVVEVYAQVELSFSIG